MSTLYAEPLGVRGGSTSLQYVVPSDVRLLLAIVVGGSALIDLPRRIELWSFSGLAYISVFYGVLALIVWLAGGYFPSPLATLLWPFGLFGAWALASFASFPVTAQGVQNLIVFAGFLAVTVAVAERSHFFPRVPQHAGRALVAAAVGSCAAYLLTVLLAGLHNDLWFGASAFSMFQLTAIAWLLASWRYGSRRSLLLALLLTGTIGVALSRLGIIAALALGLLSWLPARRRLGLLKFLVAALLVGGLGFVAVTRVPSVRDRFFGGPKTLTVGRISVNGMGRAGFWQLTWDSYLESPILGKGAGSTQALLQKVFHGRIIQPHNEYLRVLHDYGLVGLVFWGAGFTILSLRIWRAWIEADEEGAADARVHLAALLSLVSLAIEMIGNNPWIYSFVMAPVALLVGGSIGRMPAGGAPTSDLRLYPRAADVPLRATPRLRARS
jgi:O-antigen ligase